MLDFSSTNMDFSVKNIHLIPVPIRVLVLVGLMALAICSETAGQ